jgi:hypothetical protein
MNRTLRLRCPFWETCAQHGMCKTGREILDRTKEIP